MCSGTHGSRFLPSAPLSDADSWLKWLMVACFSFTTPTCAMCTLAVQGFLNVRAEI